MFQTGRNISVNDTNVFNNIAGPGATYTALTGTPLTTFQNTVGPLGKMVRGTIGVTNGNRAIAVAGDASGLGAVSFAGAVIAATAINGFIACAPFRAPLKTAQLLYWQSNDTTTAYRLNVSGYEI